MSDVYEFSTDRINIFSLLLDCSGSMREHASSMRKGLKTFKESFKNFSEADSMALAVNKFEIYYYPSDFEKTDDFDIDYSATGSGTAIYRAICKGKEQLLEYIKEVVRTNGCKPIATFVVFSDGRSEGKDNDKSEAKEAIKDLNYAGVNTVFVAFGNDIASKVGKDLGFMEIKEIEKDSNKLEVFMGEELSRSCKEQSQSLRVLGSNFFSKACNDTHSEKYSQKTQQTLNDEDWFDNI